MNDIFERCQACHGGRIVPRFVNAVGHQYVSCEECGCVFVAADYDPEPYPVDAVAAGAERRRFWLDLRSNKLWLYGVSYARWIAGHISGRLASSSPSALSVGCAYGHDLRTLKDLGWRVHGVEHDRSLVARVQAQHGIEVYHGFFEHLAFSERYDLIVMASVLPYLRNLDTTMGKVAELVKPGGYLFVSQRDIDWHDVADVLGYQTNVHARQYLTREAFRQILKRYGFRVQAFDSFSMRQPRMASWRDGSVARLMNRFFSSYDFFLNLSYIYWRVFGIGPFVAADPAEGEQLFVLAVKD